MQARSFHALSNRTFPTKSILYFTICLSCSSHLSIHPSIPLALLTFPIVLPPLSSFSAYFPLVVSTFPTSNISPSDHAPLFPFFPSRPAFLFLFSHLSLFSNFPIFPSRPDPLFPFSQASLPLNARHTSLSFDSCLHFPLNPESSFPKIPHHLTPLSKFSLSVYICSGRTFFGTSSSQTCNQTFNCTVYTSSTYNSHLPDNQLANLVTTQCTAIIILTMQHANRNRNTIKKAHGINIAIFFS